MGLSTERNLSTYARLDHHPCLSRVSYYAPSIISLEDTKRFTNPTRTDALLHGNMVLDLVWDKPELFYYESTLGVRHYSYIGNN